MATAYYTIDSSLIDENITDFPLGIKIESSTGFMTGLSADDWKYLHATVNEIDCYVEVEKWDITNEEAVLWVNIPIVSASIDTIVKIEIGAINHGVSNPSSINDDTVTIASQALSAMTYTQDGTACFMGGHYADVVYRWDLSLSPWSLPSGNPDNVYSSWSGQTNIHCVCFANDGYLLFLGGTESFQLQKWTLTTPYDLSTKTLSQTVYMPDYRGFTVSNDGLHLAIMGKIYSFGTAYDLSTLSLDGTFSSNTFACFASNDGKRIYSLHTDRYTVYIQYLAIAWDYSSASDEITLFTADSGTYELLKSVYVREKDNAVDVYLNEGVIQNEHEIIIYNDINLGHIGETGDIEAVNVWDENFNAVYHLNQNPVGDTEEIKDSTHNANHGIGIYPTNLSLTDGIFNYGVNFNSSMSYIDCGNDDSLNDIKTWMVSFYNLNGDTQRYAGILYKYYSNTNRQGPITTSLTYGNSPVFTLNGVSTRVNPVNDYYSLTAWHNYVFTNTGSEQKVFIDGSIETTDNKTMSISTGNDGKFVIGTYAYSDNYSYALRDNSKLSNVILSKEVKTPAWIKAFYNALNGTLLSYSTGYVEPEIFEPDIPPSIVGMGENLLRTLTAERGLSVGLSADETLQSLNKQIFAAITIDDQNGRTRTISPYCLSKIDLTEQVRAINANVEEIGAFETLGFNVESYLIKALSYLSQGRLRFNEQSGAFKATVKTDGSIGVALAIDETCDAIVANATFAELLSTIGFSGLPTRINDLFEVEALSSIGLSELSAKEMQSTGGALPIFGMNGAVDCLKTVNPSIPINNLSIGGAIEGFNFTQWANENLEKAVYSYHLKITGEVDGLDDYNILGLRSFQFRRNETGNSYLSCSLPYDGTILSEVTARSNGKLTIDMVATINGQESLRETIIQLNYDKARYDKGASSQSITITGYGQENISSNTIHINSITGESMYEDGRLVYRLARPDFYLSPGDKVVYNGRSIIIGQIQTIVSHENHYTEISE